MSRFELADAKKWNSAESQREAGASKQKFDWLLRHAMLFLIAGPKIYILKSYG
jgi:hypothetical protein